MKSPIHSRKGAGQKVCPLAQTEHLPILKDEADCAWLSEAGSYFLNVVTGRKIHFCRAKWQDTSISTSDERCRQLLTWSWQGLVPWNRVVSHSANRRTRVSTPIGNRWYSACGSKLRLAQKNRIKIYTSAIHTCKDGAYAAAKTMSEFRSRPVMKAASPTAAEGIYMVS